LATYSNLKNELEREGINIPEFNDINVKAITAADWALAIDVVGKDTTIKMAFEPGFVTNLGVYFLSKLFKK
jgi:hypothetical protein